MITAMRRRHASDQRLTATPRTAHTRGLPWRRLALAASIYFAQTSPTPLHAQGFSDNFESYSANTPLDPQNSWSASTGVKVQNSTSLTNYIEVPVGGVFPTAFMKPWVSYSGTYDKARWPLGRTGGDFLRVEFDLATPTASPSGRMLVMFDSKPANSSSVDNNLGLNDFGPLVAVEFVAQTTSPTFSANVWAQKASGGKDGVQSIDLSALLSTYRRFRIDFAWDYFILPHDFGFHYSPYGSQQSLGEPWFYVRLSYFDTSTGTWIQPYSRPGYVDGATDGWVELGDEKLSGLFGANQKISGKTSIDRYDWVTTGGGLPTYDPAYVYWYFDQGNGLGLMTWQIDNVSIGQVDSPPFTVMANQLGYDTAGPQWAVVRVNDPALLGNQNLVTRIDWSLTGTGISTQNHSDFFPTGQPCFKEPSDPETFTSNTGGGSPPSGFALAQDYWWRWEWDAIRAPATNCVVTATVYYGVNSHYTNYQVSSDPFSISPSLTYSAIVANPSNNIATANAGMRNATANGVHTFASGGWWDANAENGENRAIGCFLSALSNILRTRRSEISTTDLQLLLAQVENGSDFLVSEGPAENTSSLSGPFARTHQASSGGPDHDFTHSGAFAQTEMNGHIWHESHEREAGRPTAGADVSDYKNNQISEWNACVGLLDASRALQPYGVPQAGTSATQATDTRTYIKGLPNALTPPVALDALYPRRAMAMLDFIYSEIVPTQPFADAVDELGKDLLIGGNVVPEAVPPPNLPNHIQRFWIQGAQFNVNKSPTGVVGRRLDSAVYCPADPLMYAIEHNAANPPPAYLTWSQAVNTIIDQWYDSLYVMRTGTQHPNPLRLAINWSSAVALEDEYGQLPWPAGHIAVEGYACARFAQFLGRTDPRFDRLVQLATGNLNYLLGMNRGFRSRQVLHAVGAASTDFNYAGASLINGVGTRWGTQTHSTSVEYHIWPLMTTMSGPGGFEVDNTTTGVITNWSVAPFDYSRGFSGNGAETFIKTDANVIMFIDTLDRAMHPKLVVEAETGSSSGSLTIVSNNSGTTYLNGGLSVINLGSGASITYSPLIPPDNATGSLQRFRYRVRLRASNTGTVPCPVTISVTQGSNNWSDTLTVPVTTHQHDYVVVDNPIGFYSSTPLTLDSSVAFSVVLSIGGSGLGPCSFDDFVIESEGIPR